MSNFQSIPILYRPTAIWSSGMPINKETTLSGMRSEFGQRLFEARKHAELTQTQLADAVGMSQGTYGELERTGQSSSYTPAIAEKCGVNVKWLAYGSGQMAGNVLSALLSEEAPKSSLTSILSWEHEADLPQGEYVFIPRLDIHLSAGNGREQVEMDFVKKQPQAFRADWIRLEKLNPSKLACMKVDGDSMESLLYDGETVVIDTSQTTVKDGKVYALWYDGGERVKRLWKLPGGGLRIKSDNAAHPTIEVPTEHVDSVRILGRVVHKSGTGGL